MEAGRAEAPELSVIVPAFNAAGTLGRTLGALAAQRDPAGLEVIVVDDGSTDATAALAEAADGVALIRRGRGGPAAARNAGAAAARSPRLAFLDADCYPEPGWAAAGIAALEHGELVQGRVLPDPSARLGPFDRTLWVEEDRGLYQTANLFVSRRAFERCGGFEAWVGPDSDERGHFGEDVLFGWRLRRAGARAVFASEALVHHAVFPRGPLAYVRERRRLRYFPELVARVPELRRTMLFGRCFLGPRSAALDLALLAAAIAALRRSPRALGAIGPYAAIAARDARRRGGRGVAAVAVADLAADLLGAISLLAGSLRNRRVLL